MSKNILLLVTGMTPQIITETVWALACDPNNDDIWIPDEVHILSTEDGLTQIKSRLFADQIFNQFQKEYPIISHLKFNTDHLHVIKNENDIALSDLKTPEDNEHAANAICEKVREFTSDRNISLHVSIAGGRKTMGFYAGYALSLYGRAQDRMSHVLVEEKFETARDFFYPTVKSSFVTDRFGKEWDAKDAQVWLASIPFVRLKDAVKDKHQLKGDNNFSQVVHKINESFNDVKLMIDLHNRRIIVNNKFPVDLAPREFAMLHWFADERKKNNLGILAPKIDANALANKVSQEDMQYLGEITQKFLLYYDDIKNIESSDFKKNEENSEWKYRNKTRELISSDRVGLNVDKKFFESVKSNLKTSLETALGLELANRIAIRQEGRGKPFYLDVPAKNIEIIDHFKD